MFIYLQIVCRRADKQSSLTEINYLVRFLWFAIFYKTTVDLESI